MERSGCIAVIVCNATENTVRQGYCYTFLAIGGYFGRVTKFRKRSQNHDLNRKPLFLKENTQRINSVNLGWWVGSEFVGYYKSLSRKWLEATRGRLIKKNMGSCAKMRRDGLAGVFRSTCDATIFMNVRTLETPDYKT